MRLTSTRGNVSLLSSTAHPPPLLFGSGFIKISGMTVCGTKCSKFSAGFGSRALISSIMPFMSSSSTSQSALSFFMSWFASTSRFCSNFSIAGSSRSISFNCNARHSLKCCAKIPTGSSCCSLLRISSTCFMSQFSLSARICNGTRKYPDSSK